MGRSMRARLFPCLVSFLSMRSRITNTQRPAAVSGSDNQKTYGANKNLCSILVQRPRGSVLDSSDKL